ncbi:MFS transporter [Streptomyces sp. UH6]|uniref:MFS transporter n=1 Tax=Streptomyces sp. UH6 TaxID=2748379 RepID=UPI0015D48D5C|nr:MFS transporter [Streptomyces sp. UH6]NYV73309.1 MFS transporter [Streptomyces sp. UH6]
MGTYGIPLLVLATTGSATLTGLAFALEWIPRLAAFPLAGALVDRYGTARIFQAACLTRAAVVLAAAVVLTSVEPHTVAATTAVMLLAAATGVLTEVSYVAVETSGNAASHEPGRRAHQVQSVLLGIDQVATLAGPVLAGLLLEHAGPQAMLGTLAGFSLLAAALGPRQETREETNAAGGKRKGLRAGWATLRSLPALAWLVGGLVVSNTAVGLLQAAVPVLVVTELGHSSADAGAIWSVAAATSLLAVTVCRRAIDRWGLWPAGAASAVLAATATLAIATADTYRGYLLLIAVLMAGEGGLTVVLRTLRAHLIPSETFASTLAVTILLLLIPFPLAGLVVAAVPPADLPHAVAVTAVLQTIGLAVTFARLRTLRAVPAVTT